MQTVCAQPKKAEGAVKGEAPIRFFHGWGDGVAVQYPFRGSLQIFYRAALQGATLGSVHCLATSFGRMTL